MNKKDKQNKFPELELYSNIIEQIKDLASIKQINEEMAALVLMLNELRQIHWHLDELRGVRLNLKTQTSSEG